LGFEAFAGRLSELSGLGSTARLSLAMGLVCEAQRTGETAAWVTNRRSTFFPPMRRKAVWTSSGSGGVYARRPAAARAAWRLIQSEASA